MTKVKCDIPTFTPISAGVIRISGGTKSIIPHYYEDDLVSLEFNDGKVISKGEHVTVKSKTYKINIIKKQIKKRVLYYDLKTAEKTKSSIFITPMLGGEKTLWFYNQLLINVFMGISGEIEDKIVLLYQKGRGPLFKKFIEAVKQFRMFFELRDLDKDHILVIFNIPKPYIQEYFKFKNGEYSKLNKNYKLKILEYHNLNTDSMIGQILFKTKGRKKQLEHSIGMELSPDAELYSIPNLDIELFNKKYYL